MGNISSSGSNSHRRHGSRRSHSPPPPPTRPQQEITANRYDFAAVTPYTPTHYSNSNNNPNPQDQHFYQYPGYYPSPPPPMQVPLPAPYDHHHRGGGGHGHGHVDPGHWRYPYGPMASGPPPFVEHQKAVTIRNDVNLKKESLRLVEDEENPGRFLASFTFDATVDGSITVVFFAKDGEGCNLTPTKENLLPPVTVQFQQGLGQKFRQPSGGGIDFSMFEETELLKEGKMDVYPLAVKAEAAPTNQNGSAGNSIPGPTHSQITHATFEKEKGEYRARVVKQILWVNTMRYELQEIYGIGNSVEGDVDANDPGKECVICLSKPRDTTVLPCRHMCMCSGCAKVLRFQTSSCPVCRQQVERLLEIKVNGPEE